MGRDTTARKRMASKRSREKAAGLRRLNVAVNPEVFEKLAVLVKQHNCTSQARLIELLVMDNSIVSPSRKAEEVRNDVTDGCAKTKRKESSNKQQPKSQNKIPSTKVPSGKAKVVTVQRELPSMQMSLFES